MQKFRKPKTWEGEVETDIGTLSITATYEYEEGEPRVDYNRDGTGSPGVEPSVHISDLKVEMKLHNHEFVRELENEILDGELSNENPNY